MADVLDPPKKPWEYCNIALGRFPSDCRRCDGHTCAQGFKPVLKRVDE